MKAKITNPMETAAEFEQDKGARYIDVRTVAEFVSGHPRGPVVNIPILFHHPHNDETFTNDSFLLVVEDNFTNDEQIIIGDQDGERGELAADKLVEAGYTNVSVMLGGLKQWQQCALPVTGDNRDGVSYVSLLTPAKRKKKKSKNE